MSHAQAFHTSCRSGLAGISGFQVNAATPGLDPDQLAAMVDAHARYEAPRDLPYEPTADELRAFPVALKLSFVPTVGPVVSRTEYVGREYRGVMGAPDEGRFGNYFCHMVAGAAGDDPFDGLNAVELWDAPHWTTTESATPALAALGPLAPGPIGLDDVLATVAGAPPGVAVALVDGALSALDGGPPVVIVDPEASRAIAWLAWITYALPPDRAAALTFSSFEGRPRDVLGLHVVVTTPACDSGQGTGGAALRIDVTQPTSVDTAVPTLYALAAAALAAQGAEALAGAVRKVGAGSTAEQGAGLAVAGRVGELVDDDDLTAVLEHLLVLMRTERVEEVAAAVATLKASDSGDRHAIRPWAELHLCARRSAAGEVARAIASTALERLTSHLDSLPDDLPAVPPDAPVTPDVSAIGRWLRAVEAGQGGDDSGRLVRLGACLGLVGLNVPVDQRVAVVIANDLDRAAMREAFGALDAAGGHDRTVAQVAEIVAQEADSSPAGRSRLGALNGSDTARDAVRRRAEELQTFDAFASWQHMRVAHDIAARPEAAQALAAIAVDEDAQSKVRALWGERGPDTDAELAEILCAYLEAGRPAPTLDVDRGYRALVRAPLPKDRPPRDHIGYVLVQLPPATRSRAEYYAWIAGLDRPSDPATLDAWAKRTAIALQADRTEVPDERWAELIEIAAETLVDARGIANFGEALAQFRPAGFDELCEALGAALAQRFTRVPDRAKAAALEFDYWLRLPIPGVEDRVLPEAFRPLSRSDRDDVGELVSSAVRPHWEEWCERHPRAGARAAVARALGRRGKNRDEART
jgi:hypothetical protein